MRLLFSLIILISALAVHAEDKKTLRWGADVQSGAPFAFKNPKNPDQIIGFEVDIVNAIARELDLKSEFTQNHWDGLVQGLKRNDYDIVINGLEITDDRKEEVFFTVPYYFTSEILTVRKSSYDINSLEDLENKKVGTLENSLAQRILQSTSFKSDLKTYEEEIHAYDDLINGRLSAVLLDEPIAVYYSYPRPELKSVGGPIGRIQYGIAINKNNPELLRQINKAMEKLISTGELRAILENWSLWNTLSAKEWNQDPIPHRIPRAYNDYLRDTGQNRSWFYRIKQYSIFYPLLIKGAINTLLISIIAMLLAICVGLVMAIFRLYGPKFLSYFAVSFVEVVRGTPLLIQLYLIFYGLPNIGIRLDPFYAAVLGLGLNYGACESENYRAGILSVPRPQMDAAGALGMSRWQTLRYVVLPQAMKVVIPPVTNDFIALLKDSSLVSVITMVELTTVYGQLASTYFDYLGIGILIAVVYFVIGLPFVRLSRVFEMRLEKDRVRKKQNALA